MVMGGVVPVINVEGIKPGDVVLDGPTLAKIFLGEIKTWNDPAIKKLNPSVKLPAQAIVVVHRSDGSGTTFIFTDYLAEVSPDWKSKVGANTAVEWPVGIGAKGNEGVANNVAQTKGSIGYVEYAYAKQNKLTHTKHDQQGRQGGRADRRNLPGRRRQRRLEVQPGFGVILTNEPGADLADHRRDLHPDAQAAAGCGRVARSPQVLRLGLRQGRQDGGGTRLRSDARQRRQDIKKMWAAEIKDADGKPLFACPN